MPTLRELQELNKKLNPLRFGSDLTKLGIARAALARGSISREEYDKEVRELGGKIAYR